MKDLLVITGKPGLYLKFEISAGYLVGKGLNVHHDKIEKLVPDFYQSVLEQLKAKVLIFRRLVLGEGVVHVKAIELDLLQREGAVDKDPANKMLPKLILKLA